MIRLNVFIQVSEENRSAALEIAEELVRMRQLSAGRNMPLAEYPPPSYTPTGYFACSLTGVGIGVYEGEIGRAHV